MTADSVQMTFLLPTGGVTVTVDPAKLTPKARALAEAIAATDLRWITVRSVATAREIWPGSAAMFVGAEDVDKTVTDTWEHWASSGSPARRAIDAYSWLEYEARKMGHGWYPVADDGTDLPSSPAARADDRVTPDDALELLRRWCPPGTAPNKAQWMQYAIRGQHGYPAPAGHNGITSLWSAADLNKYANYLLACRMLGEHRNAAETAVREATDAVKSAVLLAVGKGMPDTTAETVFQVSRHTVRAWKEAAARDAAGDVTVKAADDTAPAGTVTQ